MKGSGTFLPFAPTKSKSHVLRICFVLFVFFWLFFFKCGDICTRHTRRGRNQQRKMGPFAKNMTPAEGYQSHADGCPKTGSSEQNQMSNEVFLNKFNRISVKNTNGVAYVNLWMSSFFFLAFATGVTLASGNLGGSNKGFVFSKECKMHRDITDAVFFPRIYVWCHFPWQKTICFQLPPSLKSASSLSPLCFTWCYLLRFCFPADKKANAEEWDDIWLRRMTRCTEKIGGCHFHKDVVASRRERETSKRKPLPSSFHRNMNVGTFCPGTVILASHNNVTSTLRHLCLSAPVSF